MIIVSYDISDDKLRTQFSKYLSKFGYRLQYSVFQIKHSDRMLSIIRQEIEGRFEKKFTQSDSVMILTLSKQCHITRYGYAKNEETDLLIVG